MTADDVAAPASCTAHEVVLHHVPNMSGSLQIGFTPSGPADTPEKVEQQIAQAHAHASAAGETIDSDEYACLTHLALDADMWRDMGEPETITVRVLPGDTLTPEHDADGFGPVTEVKHIPGKGEPAALVRHAPVEDTRPQHDDVTNDDVREVVVADPPPEMAPADVDASEVRSV